MRTPEYDDGYDSKESFERADEDRPEDMEPVGLVDCEPTVGDVFGWLDDDQLAEYIGKELAQALNIDSFAGGYMTSHGVKSPAGLARLTWALIHAALPNH